VYKVIRPITNNNKNFNNFKITTESIGFVMFIIHALIFFCIPEIVQKPFKILIGFTYFAIFFIFLINKKIGVKEVCLGFLLILFSSFIIYNGAFQSSLVNVVTAGFGLLIISQLKFNLTSNRLLILNIVFWIGFISIILQMLIYRSSDGRPKLGYEINLSAAILFLFFLFSDIIKNRYGKILVVLLAMIILSRLLILAILLFTLIKYITKKINSNRRYNFLIFAIITYVVFFVFNIWFLQNVEIGGDYNSSADRIVEVNDGSNKLRFTTNLGVLYSIFIEKDPVLIFGYGNIDDVNNKFQETYPVIPHNELLASIAEYGYLATIFFFYLSLRLYRNYFKLNLFHYLIPLFIYTLILWVRFIIIPSFEMIFIIMLLYLKSSEKTSNKIIHYKHGNNFFNK